MNVSFLKLRSDFNAMDYTATNYCLLFYVTIIMFLTIKFALMQWRVNLPASKRDFNAKMKQKPVNFIDRLHKQDKVKI